METRLNAVSKRRYEETLADKLNELKQNSAEDFLKLGEVPRFSVVKTRSLLDQLSQRSNLVESLPVFNAFQQVKRKRLKKQGLLADLAQKWELLKRLQLNPE